jgi:hypothetical protein
MSHSWRRPGTGQQSAGARLAAVIVSLLLAVAGPSHAADPVARPGSAGAVEASGVSVDGLVRREAAAARFAMYLLSPEGQGVLARFGLQPVTAPGS